MNRYTKKLEEALKRFNFKLVIALAVSIIFFLGVFLVVWDMGYEWIISGIYAVITLIAAGWYIFTNRGILGKLPGQEELPATWDRKQREDFLTDLKHRRQKSKKAMVIILPMIVVFLYKILDLYLFPNFSLTLFFSTLFGG